jgi:streptomycin 6-kinase
MHLVIPPLLAKHCSKSAERGAWLAALPAKIRTLEVDWGISLSAPFDHDYVSCSWVAAAVLRDGTRGVLKVGMPHMEAEQEIEGLRFWDGDPTVRVLQSDLAANAMLLERCEPGVPLLSVAETTQDLVITAILKRLWRKPSPGVFRPLSALIAYWSDETRQAQDRWSDPTLVNEGLQVFATLADDANDGVLLATDLHAGNVLQAAREPWLMIDPKPFVGDRAYDLTQHLFNCEQRLQDDPYALIRRVSDLAEVDAERVRMWLFARAAAEPRQSWLNDWKMELARKLSR